MDSLFEFPWKEFLFKCYRKALDADLLSRSAQVAFYFAFSLFPLLFFLVSLFGLILDSTEGLQREMFAYLRQIMPATAFDLVQRTVQEVVETSSTGKLTFGLLLTLWSASAGIDSIRNALNAVYGLRESRWWWKRKLQSIGITLIFILLTAVVLLIVFYGWQLFRSGLAMIGIEVTSPLILISIQWISILFVMLFVCEVIYNLLPNYKRLKWRWVTPGSIVAIALWLLLTNGFRLYLGYFNSYSKAYGSLGAVIILLLWLYLTALVVIVGGAINSVYSSIEIEKAETGSVTDTETTNSE